MLSIYLHYHLPVDGTKQTPIEAKLIKDGKPMPIKDVEVIVGEDKVTFKIKKPSRDQSGPYEIKLSNGQGEDVKKVKINMQGKLIFIKLRITVIDCNKIYFYRRRSNTTSRCGSQGNFPKFLRCGMETITR